MRRRTDAEIGLAVKRAATNGLVVDLAQSTIDVGCDCVPENAVVSKAGFRINLRQAFLIVTAAAILLSVFQRPLSLLPNDAQVARVSAAPWSVYRWVFFDGQIINPKPMPKTPIVLGAFLANTCLAMLVPFGVGWLFLEGFKRLWRKARA